MKLLRSERRMLAAALSGLAVMLMLFVVNALSMAPLTQLPVRPVPAREEPGELCTLVDINAAGLDELMTLPGIGEVRARAILDYRRSHGPFRYPEDLIRVKGVGEGIVTGLLDYVTTGGTEDAENIGS